MTEDGEIRSRETVLTTKKSVCTNQSLDYIFRYIPKRASKKKRNHKVNKTKDKYNKIFRKLKLTLLKNFKF